jgi:C_GCAxxG_C_C family probable redox protein
LLLDYFNDRGLLLLKRFRRRRPLGADAEQFDDSAAKAGELFDRGYNCSQAVLQATTGRDDSDLLAMTEGFGGGIGDTGCLCGAIAGGVMALGLAGKADQSKELMTAFKEEFRTTCCRGLSREHKWLSKEHLANCRQITTTTAQIVEKLLKE